MTGRLASFVFVTDDGHEDQWFGPESDVPEWAARKIVNEKAWAEKPDLPADDVPEPEGDEAEKAPEPAKRGPGRPAKAVADK
ncbi:hypothetical protein [Clavibacter capsici]|uniref:hypothetical protein n=1 Tax=Clavibacter capsici TaxID=1874630 RepID=UPI0014285678|nr:hypothetical protein [Clavibacter capsici]QIS38617.1 hypothetical protein GW572_04380 [Clavibacter capsici]